MQQTNNPFGGPGSQDEEARDGQLAWSDDLETGVEILDQQHRGYIDLLNDYLEKAAVESDESKQAERVLESFDFLRRYAADHFSSEDAIMEATAYPDFPAHLEEHQRFVNHVEGLYRQAQANGITPGLSREINFYAVEWFVDHILDSDMKLAHFLKERNLEKKASEFAS